MGEGYPWVDDVARRVHHATRGWTGDLGVADEVTGLVVERLARGRAKGSSTPNDKTVVAVIEAVLDERPGPAKPATKERRVQLRAALAASAPELPPVYLSDLRLRLVAPIPEHRSRDIPVGGGGSRRLPVIAAAVVVAVVVIGAVLATRGGDDPGDGASPAGPTGSTAPRSDPTAAPTTSTAPAPVATLPGGQPAPTMALSVNCAGRAELTWSAFEGLSFATYLVLRAVGGTDPAYPVNGAATELRGGSRSADETVYDDDRDGGTESRWLVVAVDRAGRELARTPIVSCPAP